VSRGTEPQGGAVRRLEESLEAARGVAARARGRVAPNRWWRVGYHHAPLDFVPRELYSWEHRFDDPEHEYRTIYCAEMKLTALREVLVGMIWEYGRHMGHVDLLRERIDGRIGQ